MLGDAVTEEGFQFEGHRVEEEPPPPLAFRDVAHVLQPLLQGVVLLQEGQAVGVEVVHLVENGPELPLRRGSPPPPEIGRASCRERV